MRTTGFDREDARLGRTCIDQAVVPIAWPSVPGYVATLPRALTISTRQRWIGDERIGAVHAVSRNRYRDLGGGQHGRRCLCDRVQQEVLDQPVDGVVH